MNSKHNALFIAALGALIPLRSSFAQVAQPATPAPARNPPSQPQPASQRPKPAAPIAPVTASTPLPHAAPPSAGGKMDNRPASLGWWNDTIFYQVNVRSFADCNLCSLANDGVGDLFGLIDNLNYINDNDPRTSNDLNLNGLYVMPVMPAKSVHGYDALDFTSIAKEYGVPEDFRRLVREAHKRGIKVIVDFPLNHTSDEHAWFKEAIDPKSPRHSWYIWSASDPGYKGPWDQTVWHRLAGPTPEPFYYGLFGPHMPDLNLRNPDTTKAITDAASFWIKSAADGGMDADGLRLDAARHLIEEGKEQENTPATHAWLRDFHSAVNGVKKDAITVAEVWSGTDQVAKYTPDQTDLSFEFELAGATVLSAASGQAKFVADAMDKVAAAYQPNQFATFLTNQDQDRVMTQVHDDPNAAILAAVMLLAGPGVPFIYYGEELAMPGEKADDNNRSPMQWTQSVNAGFTLGPPWHELQKDWKITNVSFESGQVNSVFNNYRRLIHLRQGLPALSHGSFMRLLSDRPDVYAFMRWADVPPMGEEPAQTQIVVVVLNLGKEAIANYGLSALESPIRKPFTTEKPFPPGKVMDDTGEGLPSVPKINQVGGFSGYQPVFILAPQTGYIIQFGKKIP